MIEGIVYLAIHSSRLNYMERVKIKLEKRRGNEIDNFCLTVANIKINSISIRIYMTKNLYVISQFQALVNAD